MWTARDVTEILRREMDDPNLVVRLSRYQPDGPDDRRWTVCERRKRMYGPFEAAGMRFKVVGTLDDEFYVHAGPKGEYLPLDPYLILAAVRKQDAWVKANRPRSMVARIRENEQKKFKAQSQLFEDIAVDSRRMVAQAADEMGL